MRNNLSGTAKRRLWEEHIAQWTASGLSQVEYCRTNKIALSSFQNWKRKSKLGGSQPALVEVPLPRTLPIPILPAHPQLCLVVGQHYRIEIRKGFDAEDLERVVRVLGRI